MNPYDFVPIDTQHPPERRRPVWHNALVPAGTHPGKLYSGYLYLYIKAETPLFIPDTNSPERDPRDLREHIRNKADFCIIPGTSIKGLLRTVVETLCRGCITVFRKPQEYTHNPLPPGFAYCADNTDLCIACRLFGMMQAGQRDAKVFLGKVNIGDAEVYEDSVRYYKPIYTAVLDNPKPRHRAFYLDLQGRYIAGRKFYFHHHGEPRTADRLLEIRNRPGEYRNQYIEPLDRGTEFSARLDFTNLEADEFAALMLAISLQADMRHKIGYGKPIGLGSVRIEATELHLVNYATRYTAFRAGRGMSKYGIDELPDLVDEQMASFDPQVNAAWLRFSTQPALQQLHCIWQWPPDTSVAYAYPSQRWFQDNSQKRIQDTRNLYPGD